jgi:hypothetical protein
VLPISVDGLLNHPQGGILWITDPLNALVMVPLQAVLPLPAAWTVLVFGHQAAAGVCAWGLARTVIDNEKSAWIASILYTSSPVLLCHIQNGASEAVGGAWLPAAAWALFALKQEFSWKRLGLSGLLCGLCLIGQWYAGVCLGILGLALASRRVLGALVIGGVLAMPHAVLSHWASTTEGNVIGIKQEKELMAVRRTIGPADAVAFVVPGDYRSPDFRELSRYGEEYIHSPYLGLVGLAIALIGLFTGKSSKYWWFLLAAGFLLSLGPVLVHDGSPVILPGKRAIPLPYLLLEPLPGFSSLSLLWRFSQLSALSLSILAALAWPSRWPVWLPCLLIIAEIRWFSPLAGKPATTNCTPSAPMLVLAQAPLGAVMNFPLAGGRAYLFEQTIHQKPLAASLNFPNNRASMKVWKAALDNKNNPELSGILSATARAADIRYLVVHSDAMARPDMHDAAVRAIKQAFTPIADTPSIRVYQFW